MNTYLDSFNSWALVGVRQQWCAWLVYYMCSRLVAGDLEHVCVHGQNANNGLCGEQLAGILKLLCGAGGYNGFGKRSAAMSQPNTAVLDAENLEGHKIFLPREEAVRYFEKRSVSKWDSSGHGYQGIVCECCYNRCGIMELKQYCAYGGGGSRPERNRRRRYRARAQNGRRWELQRESGHKMEQPKNIIQGSNLEQRVTAKQLEQRPMVTANEIHQRPVVTANQLAQRPAGVETEQPAMITRSRLPSQASTITGNDLYRTKRYLKHQPKTQEHRIITDG